MVLLMVLWKLQTPFNVPCGHGLVLVLMYTRACTCTAYLHYGDQLVDIAGHLLQSYRFVHHITVQTNP